MQLLHAGGDTSVIALRLGHKTPQFSPPPSPLTTPSSTRSRPHRHRRNRPGLNKIRNDSTNTRQADEDPVTTPTTAPLTTPSGAVLMLRLSSRDDAIIVILSDPQRNDVPRFPAA